MKVTILGCGAYGMALSNILIDNNCEVTLWTTFEEEKNQLEKNLGNEKLIPNFKISEKIKITTNIKEAIEEKDLLVIAIPAAFVDSVAKEMKPYIKDNHILIATKGIEQNTGLFINQIIEKNLDTKNIAVISGPSFAIDIVSRMPIGLSLATNSLKTEQIVKKCFSNNYVKLRSTKDIIGVEICGSIKNIIAIAAGMLEGLGANESTKAMLLTEATHDIEEIIKAFNGKHRTINSYAGFGDLILTCTSEKSRNYSFGELLGKNAPKEEIELYKKTTTVEGFYTIKSIYQLLKNKKIKIPTIDLIYNIAVKGEDPKKLLTFLVEKK